MQAVRMLPCLAKAPITLARGFATAAERLLSLHKVQIKEGENLYLLLTVYIHGQTRHGRLIIRGWETDDHDKIYKKIKADMKKLGLCIKANGGGYIDNNKAKERIEIYGACSTHGRADHYKTREILRSWSKFRGYRIKVTDTDSEES